jgi:enamine deaminase RidA (YjgF/YER057c/UK114 family)
LNPRPVRNRPHLPLFLLDPNTMTTHTRIRKFNTRETYPEQKLDNDLCQAVIAGNTIYLRGQIGQDLDTRESVGKVTVYLIDPRYREAVYNVMGRWLKGVFPVSTGIVVQALARPEWLVEIDVVAVKTSA